MDLSSMLMPGVQSVVTAVLGDAWTATRDFMARGLSRHGAKDDNEAGTGTGTGTEVSADLERVVRELDVSRARSLAPFSDGEPDRRFVEGFWYCYLTGMLDRYPDLAGVLADLVNATPGQASVTSVSIVNSGTVSRLVQNAGDIQGDVTMH